MTFDPMTANPCPPFCDEFCEVGIGESGTRHKSGGVIASLGGLMGNDEFNTSGRLGFDLVPSVAVAQKLNGKAAEVVLRVDTWMVQPGGGWVAPSEFNALVQEHTMTADRAEYLAKLLIDAAQVARRTPVSPARVTA